jgi:hypothetical protein
LQLKASLFQIQVIAKSGDFLSDFEMARQACLETHFVLKFKLSIVFLYEDLKE